MHKDMHTHRHPPPHTRMLTPVSQGYGTEETVCEKSKVSQEDSKEQRGSMTDRTRYLVPGSWKLVKERVLTTRLCVER